MFDPQIERSFHGLVRSHKISEKITIYTKQIANLNNKTLKELITFNVKFQPLCLNYPKVDGAFKLK